MAKILVHDDCIDIRVGLLERMMLAERSRKLPLSSVRKVDPHPPLLDMMVHWADQSSVWMCGVSSYEGHMIPSARNPKSTLAIELSNEPQIFVEIDDEPPEQAAQRIVRALGSEPPPPPAGADEPSLALEARAPDEPVVVIDDAQEAAYQRSARQPEPPQPFSEPARALQLEHDRDLARLGNWLVALGSLGVLTGVAIVAAGAIPGLLAAGAGLACAALGGVALAVVAHHRG